MEGTSKHLTILHFNDVYNLEEKKKEPVGGVARFKTALQTFKHLDPLILFSGDLFLPSLCTIFSINKIQEQTQIIVSIVYNGEQMIKPINELGIHAACFGNHEFVRELKLLGS